MRLDACRGIDPLPLDGIAPSQVVATKGDAKKGPTTHTRKKGHSPDFLEAFASYLALDEQLYDEGAAMLEEHLGVFPRCRAAA